MSSLGPWFGGGGGGRRGGYDPWYGSPFSSDIWDPFSSGSIWSRDQDRSRGGAADETAALAHVDVDWHETDNAHIFRADIPGVRKEELKVQVEDGNVLRISGERVREQEDTNDKWHRLERTRGTFVRRFRLPENSNPDQIECSLDHGVLTVTVPKTEVEPTPRNVRQIDVA